MRLVITGADGFIGKNVRARLREAARHDVRAITRNSAADQVAAELAEADFVLHLAGVNRPRDRGEFVEGNLGFTDVICRALARSERRVPVAYTSSAQAALDNPYGRSKRAAEERLLAYKRDVGAPVYLLRLPNVFGKWCKPHYNSAVATFCHQLARGLPIRIDDPKAPLRLLYVDDLVDRLVGLLDSAVVSGDFLDVGPVYETTVGGLVEMLEGFVDSRESLLMPNVGTGLPRALYATYVSYLPPEAFAYTVPTYADPRGAFVEMLKTESCGQFSYFTARPGITRGEHYHHSKTEKFLVISGTAHFGFRNIDTGQVHELTTRGGEARIVESIPGWAHNITNVGDDELIVMLWANEVFDRSRPDTVAMKVVS